MPRTTIEHLNPEGLHRNPAFSQAIAVKGPHRVVYVGGQNAVDGDGRIVGKGDIQVQAEQVLRNIELALAAGGATHEHVVKWTIYIVQGQPAHAAYATFQRKWGNNPTPPTISVLYVAGLAHPEFLLEIDAIAVVPEED